VPFFVLISHIELFPSGITLLVVEGDEKGTLCLGYMQRPGPQCRMLDARLTTLLCKNFCCKIQIENQMI
jgi:hypothetical protein